MRRSLAATEELRGEVTVRVLQVRNPQESGCHWKICSVLEALRYIPSTSLLYWCFAVSHTCTTLTRGIKYERSALSALLTLSSAAWSAVGHGVGLCDLRMMCKHKSTLQVHGRDRDISF
jgi:hypothetical protein